MVVCVSLYLPMSSFLRNKKCVDYRIFQIFNALVYNILNGKLVLNVGH